MYSYRRFDDVRHSNKTQENDGNIRNKAQENDANIRNKTQENDENIRNKTTETSQVKKGLPLHHENVTSRPEIILNLPETTFVI